ncbi:MAG: sugar phosphate isomerase/epimerase, partial [Clostridia bacterium]|nr:sugar phosphate isomerase/epimerase [Clostridia bacterium]
MEKFRLCAFADEADKAISGQVKALHENEIKLIELRGVDGKNVADLIPSEAQELKKRFDCEGIAVWSIGSPIGKVDITSPAADELDRFKRVLETANVLSAENIRMFSFYKTDDSSACFDEICRRLDDMISAAKGSGVDLCHENEKGIFGDTAERCYKLHSALPAFRGVFDPANFVQCGEDTLVAWELLKPFMKYAHIKDAKEDGKVVPPGVGIGHLPELLPRFAESGIEVLTLEPHLKSFVGLAALEGGDTQHVGSSFKDN